MCYDAYPGSSLSLSLSLSLLLAGSLDSLNAQASLASPVETRDLTNSDPYVFELMLRLFATFDDEIKRTQLEDTERAEATRRRFAKEVSLPPEDFSRTADLASATRAALLELDRKGSKEAETALKAGRQPDHKLFLDLERSRLVHLSRALKSLSTILPPASYEALSHWFWTVFMKSVQRRPMS